MRGPWIASGYHRQSENSAWEDGWFDTGDIATIDEQGFLSIVDRAKEAVHAAANYAIRSLSRLQ